MRGALSQKELIKREAEIDALLDGRDPKASDLEETLKELIGDYSYEVDYYNMLHRETLYQNKYGTSTPSRYLLNLSLANTMVNGKYDEKNNIILLDQDFMSKESKRLFTNNSSAFFQSPSARQYIASILEADQSQPSPNSAPLSLPMAKK